MPKRTDSTQSEVVDALRRCGVFVTSLHTVGRGVPDLLLSFRGRWYLAEVKRGRSSKLTERQREFKDAAKAPIFILTSAAEAVTWARTIAKGNYSELSALIEQVQRDHVARLDVPVDDLQPKPRKKKKPPRTSIISEAAHRKYVQRVRDRSLIPDEAIGEAVD